MPTQDNALVIFARAPESGAVKTRLTAAYKPSEANEIHMALLGDVVERALRALSGKASITLAWSVDPGKADPLPEPLPAGLSTEVQPSGDLGERMALTIQERLHAGSRRVVILGSDAPTLPEDHLTEAFEVLCRKEVVVGPADDGGYYLIGMSRLHLGIFRNVRWGTADVLPVTRQRLKQARIPYQELGTWHDVDTPEDLQRLWRELLRLKERHPREVPTRTYHLLSRLAPGTDRT